MKSYSNTVTDNFSEAIVETTRESILGLNRDLRINFANKSFYTTFKVTPKETVGRLIYELGNGQWNIPKLKGLLEDILPKENTFENFEILHNFLGLGQKTMLLNARRLHRKPGEEPTILLVIEDITERKKLEDKFATYASGLEEEVAERTESIAIEKARDEAILQSIGDGLVVVDQDGKIVYVNKAFENLLGWEKQEVVGKLMVEIVPREDDAGKEVPFKERVLSIVLSNKNSTTTTTTTTYYYIRKDGSRFPASSIITSILLDQKIIGAVETFRDISKESAVDKAKTEFVSLASHQLLTPASTISWYAEMLLSGDVGKITDDQKKYLDEIYHGNQRMVKLISSLLNVSRLELGTFMVSPEPTDITTLAQSVIDEQKPRIEERKITITAKYERGIPVLSVDPNLIRIVFQNLLSNAVKYTPEGGKVTMEVSLLEGSKIQIKVSDTGCGIPKDQQNQMFTKLFRTDNVREKDIEGTGLGLYIVKSIIDNSAGKIWFESQEGKGTTFYVTLPLEGMKRKEGTKSLS